MNYLIITCILLAIIIPTAMVILEKIKEQKPSIKIMVNSKNDKKD